jgi:hypothetical protein
MPKMKFLIEIWLILRKFSPYVTVDYENFVIEPVARDIQEKLFVIESQRTVIASNVTFKASYF